MADDAPARVTGEMTDQAGATPDRPVSLAPIKLASILADWSERWIDVEQVVPDHLVKADSSGFAMPAPEQKVDLIVVAHGVALFTFGFGLVLTFLTLLMRSGTNWTGPPSMDGASPTISGFAADQPDETSHPPQTDGDDFGAKPQSPTAALKARATLGRRSLGTARHLVVVLISRQAKFICWKVLRWGRDIHGLIDDGAYPMEVKWPPHSAGAMISREDVSRPFTVPSRLLEETRQAASGAVSPPASHARTA